MCVMGCRCTSTHQNKVIRGKMGKQGCGKWIGMSYTTQKRRKQSRMVALVREDHGGNDGGERGYLWIIGIHIRKVITHMHEPPPKKGKTNSCTCWCNQVQNKKKQSSEMSKNNIINIGNTTKRITLFKRIFITKYGRQKEANCDDD